MATLLLTTSAHGSNEGRGTRTTPLRAWMNGGWAILFSHPQDFIRCDLEIDRWHTILRRTFAERCVRPLAVAKTPRTIDDGWISQVSGDASIVTISDSRRACRDVADLHAHALLEDIAGIDGRFVMTIDSLLCRRETFVYHTLDHLPSPLDFLCLIEPVRRSGVPAGRGREAHRGEEAPERDSESWIERHIRNLWARSLP